MVSIDHDESIPIIITMNIMMIVKEREICPYVSGNPTPLCKREIQYNAGITILCRS